MNDVLLKISIIDWWCS